jgi:hypothetical protein
MSTRVACAPKAILRLAMVTCTPKTFEGFSQKKTRSEEWLMNTVFISDEFHDILNLSIKPELLQFKP